MIPHIGGARVSDERLRVLDRRWKQSGVLEDGVEWAKEMIRLGVTAKYMVRFAPMWDADSQWRLLRRIEYRQRLVVRFAGDSPSTSEIRAVRELDPALGGLPAREALARLRNLAQVDLGEQPGLIARRLLEKAKSLGLDAILEDRSHSQILPVAEGEDEPWTTCDPGIEEEIVLRMLASGIDITEEEVAD